MINIDEQLKNLIREHAENNPKKEDELACFALDLLSLIGSIQYDNAIKLREASIEMLAG